MEFNYEKEKRLFLSEWKKLRLEYQLAGMSEEAIDNICAFDWKWFCQRRNYINHVQQLPTEFIDDEAGYRNTNVLKSLNALSVQFDESDFADKYAWLDTIDTVHLADKLKRLSSDDLDLLTLMVIHGFKQADIARDTDRSRSSISQKIKRIKKILQNKK